jgi:CheY-like chemotaxis protein
MDFLSGGGELGALMRARDERVLAEQALKQADVRKDEFIATLSHELRNPLAPLSHSLQVLKLTGATGADAQPLHEIMERQVNHLVRLVDDLLEMARITRGRLELRRERVEVATVVRNAVETSDPLIQAAGHRLTVSLPGEPLWVDGDPVRLAQILANLLNNSARYTERGGEIAVHARREDGMAAIAVRDNGSGIPPQILPEIFEMFSRGERGAAYAPGGGLGIGLALARRLAEMHGGTLHAHSEGPGRGAEFLLRVPLAAHTPRPAAAAPDAGVLPGKRILVVDDNRDAADSLAMLLNFLGAEVNVVYDGAFESYRPGVVLLDIGMPGMDGFTVARRLREAPGGRGVPIVAITGWGQEEDRRRAREAGFDHHLVKPPDMTALRSLLGALH